MFARQRLALMVLFAPPLLLAPAFADWPHLRGPNYDGVSSERGLADSWPAQGPPQLWARDLGQGYSGFIVADGRLYTQRQTIGGQFVLCLDPETGDTLWETRTDWAWQPGGAYPGPYSSPTYHKGLIFYTSTTGIAGCLDARTGAAVWSLNVKDKFKGKGVDFGYAATPLVESDLVILPVGGPNASLVALHVEDGRTIWTAGSDPASYCPAFPITLQGRRCVVGYLQNAMILVELASGKVLHRQPISAGYNEHSAWPIYREPRLALLAPFRVPAEQLELTETFACKRRWLSKEMCNDVVSSVLYENHLYGFDLKQLQASPSRASRGVFKCLAWETGKLCWSAEDVGHASVIAADGKLLMLNDTGTLILARADADAYRELARAELFAGEICWTPPLLWRGRVVARSPSKAVCVYIGAPDRQPSHAAHAPPQRSWRLDPAWLLTREREYPNDAPTWEEMALWFAACVLLAAGALPLTALIRLAAQRAADREVPGTPIFLGIAFVLGALGPNLFSAGADECLFTWPLSLYAAFHGVVLTYDWAKTRQTELPRSRWLARLSVLIFLLVVDAYFEACKSVGMFVAWSFLVGFPPALPFTFLAARAALNGQRAWVVAAWTLLAFGAFFWSAQGLLLWKAAE